MPVIEEAPNPQATPDVVAVAEAIVERLERAWNSANGVAFGEPFSTDADFVAIRGDLHTGRDAIAEGHQQILDTIYAGSTARYEVLHARELDDRVILAHVRCTVRPIFSTQDYTCSSKNILPRIDPSPIQLPAAEHCTGAQQRQVSFIWDYAG